MRIIGLAGTNGSGKDTVGQILADEYGYLFVSVTDILRDELKRRKLEPNRENLRALSSDWRRETGRPGILVDKALERYEQAGGRHTGLVLASLRHSGEADRVHQLGGRVVWIDADPRFRYDRIQRNAASRHRPEEDNKTYEQFLAEEQAEMNQSGDTATLNMSAVQSRSDLFIDNDSDDIDKLKQTLRTIAGQLG